MPPEIARPLGTVWVIVGDNSAADGAGRGNKSGDAELAVWETLLIVTESWLQAKIPDDSVESPGRTLHHQDHNKDSSKGRAVGSVLMC